jgi:hypothetical protein
VVYSQKWSHCRTALFFSPNGTQACDRDGPRRLWECRQIFTSQVRRKLVRMPGVEPGSMASEATTLSIVLHSRQLNGCITSARRKPSQVEFAPGAAMPGQLWNREPGRECETTTAKDTAPAPATRGSSDIFSRGLPAIESRLAASPSDGAIRIRPHDRGQVTTLPNPAHDARTTESRSLRRRYRIRLTTARR